MRISVVLAILTALLLSSCKFQRVETANLAKTQLVGMTKEQILSCMGGPAAINKAGGTEVWTYGSGGGSVGVGTGTTHTTGTATSFTSTSSAFFSSQRRYCKVDIVLRNARVQNVNGENISTIEVEGVLFRHPEVLEAAVVARPDEKWGETPCAFVTKTEDGQELDSEGVISFCRENMAHYKAPKTIVFGDLPKTSTGKIQKFVLRERAREM